MTKNKNAQQAIEYWTDALTEYCPWELWEVKHPRDELWLPANNATHALFYDDRYDFRRKPKIININGFDVPEPIRPTNIPADGDPVYFTSLTYPEAPNEHRWHRDTHSDDHPYILNGFAHRTRGAAIAHGKALVSFTAIKEADYGK